MKIKNYAHVFQIIQEDENQLGVVFSSATPAKLIEAECDTSAGAACLGITLFAKQTRGTTLNPVMLTYFGDFKCPKNNFSPPKILLSYISS